MMGSAQNSALPRGVSRNAQKIARVAVLTLSAR